MAENTRIALYVTCLINALRHQAARASLELLESLGLTVEIPIQQSCCGQPAYNSGNRSQALEIAQHQIKVLEPYGAVVVPSGSCTGMIRNHYPTLFDNNDPWYERAIKLAEKTYELSEFLQTQDWKASSYRESDGWVHHTSCSCRRETHSVETIETVLKKKGVRTLSFPEPEVCCGFGGAFSTKFDDISCRMGNKKLDQIESSGADKVLSADYGCLMHLQGLASRQGRKLRFHHLAEVLNMK